MSEGDTRGRSSWRNLLAASWISNVGDGIRLAALPLLAIDIGGTATSVSLIVAAAHAPMLVIGLPAGALADRIRRKPLVVGSNVFRAVVAGGLLLAILSDVVSIPLLVLVAMLLGVGEAVGDSALAGVVYDLVDDDDLESANGQMDASNLIANDLVGPPIGSATFGIAVALPVVADLVSFSAAAALTASVSVTEDHVANDRPTTSMRQQVREGLSYVQANPVLRVSGAFLVVLSFFHLGAMAPFAVYLTSDEGLGLSATGYGVALAAGGAAAGAGSAVAARIVARFGAPNTLAFSLTVCGLGFSAMASQAAPLVVFGYVLSFFGIAIGRVMIVAARQRATSASYQGRVQSVMRVGIWGANAVGAVFGGVVSEAFGLHVPSALAAIAYTGVLVVGVPAFKAALTKESMSR